MTLPPAQGSGWSWLPSVAAAELQSVCSFAFRGAFLEAATSGAVVGVVAGACQKKKNQPGGKQWLGASASDVEDDDVVEEDEDEDVEDETEDDKVEEEDVQKEEDDDVGDDNVEEDDEKDDNVAEDEVEDDDVAEEEVEDDDVKGEEDDDVENDDAEEEERMILRRRRTDPKTALRVLCEPAQSKCTWTFHKSHFA